MQYPSFWMLDVVVKLLLFLVLLFFIQKTKKAIDTADAIKIKSNFKIVEMLTYVIVLFNYGLFATKYIQSKSPNENNSLGCINLVLVLVLFSFMMQMKSAISVAEKGAVPVSFLADNFRMIENLTYTVVGFNVINNGLMFFDKHGETMISSISPRSKRKN
jgi:Ca2+/Na+ antiporter